MSSGPAWLSADDAIALLGVSRATLYAYVSRGRIRSEPAPGSTRRRRYSKDDIELLLARNRERRNPEAAAGQALNFGLPILESSITLIADDKIYYRGRDAIELARTASIADVAALIWLGTADGARIAQAEQAALPACSSTDATFVATAQSAIALAAAADPLAFDLRTETVARTGWHILRLLTDVATRTSPANEPQTTTLAPDATPDERLAANWDVPSAAPLIRAALILSADHELNVSAFTARCVASAGAAPYGVVLAGLAALEGFRHGGTTARIDALWTSLTDGIDLTRALSERLRRGERIDGFGHPLYPSGDPRARFLLGMLPESDSTEFARRFADSAQRLIGELPTLDFALVAIARVLGLPSGTALTLFALGRTIGWIGQAIEQYADGSIIRPRARYAGKVPA